MQQEGRWDPVGIVAQMVCVQALFYLGATSALFVLDAVAVGEHVTARQLFSPHEASIAFARGWIVVGAFVINAAFSSVCLMVVVEKAKKCLDFAATEQLFHILACIAYSREIPFRHPVWWILQVTCVLITYALGEYLCVRKELRELPRNLFGQPKRVVTV
eukprot:TRINITY_DN6231_c0_g1_i1.p1 TRINITY_DN6231_c0_g1~~TRINITY_DN6231_c0_g1_i1.p1  ORF type:complete len:160 (-),score=40.83 TRINITY_DN6231_c0_g1_i1:114-593(-)